MAAILFAVRDRDRPRPQEWDRRPAGILHALTLHRPWRLLAGMALGAAVAVKWSGAYVALAVIGLTAAWEIAARRSAGPDAPPRSWTSATWLAIREELPRSLVLLGLVPVAVYLAAYIGRMPGELIGLPWQEGTVWRGIWEHQQAMLTFHTTLEGSHPYESPPWSWLLLKRPVAYYFDASDGYREILAIGNPLTWAAGVLGLLALAVLWARGRLARGRPGRRGDRGVRSQPICPGWRCRATAARSSSGTSCRPSPSCMPGWGCWRRWPGAPWQDGRWSPCSPWPAWRCWPSSSRC